MTNPLSTAAIIGSGLGDARRAPIPYISTASSRPASRPASRPPSPPQPAPPKRNLTVPLPLRPSLLNPSPPPSSPPNLPNFGAAVLTESLSRQSSERSGHHSNQTDDNEIHGNEPDDVHPLQAEIDRLIALCDQHELKFRSSKASFEHRVFSEFPSVLGRLSELDSRAEKATADLYAEMHEAVPKLEGRLSTLLDERAEDVETMRERMTPWTAFLDDDEENKLQRTRSGRGRIGKIERVRKPSDANDYERADTEALAMFERWADEVELHLTDEIAELERQIGEENRKRSVIFSAFVLAVIVLVVVVVGHGLRVGVSSLLARYRW